MFIVFVENYFPQIVVCFLILSMVLSCYDF